MSKVQGTIKWFSNKKGYGFITPTSDNAPTKEDIFVHQSTITSEGYRTLGEGWEVEFEVVHDDDGKLKAVSVTAPGGGPCTGPRVRRDRKKPTGDGEAEEKPIGENGDGAARNRRKKKPVSAEKVNGDRKPKEKQPQWHDVLTQEVKDSLAAKDVRMKTGTVDVAVDKARVKLGTRGYSSMAHADGVLAEGSFTCDEQGFVTFEWARALEFTGGEWKVLAPDSLIKSFNLTDDTVSSVGMEETAETLWGEGKSEPKDALEANGFQMRQVVLTPKKGGRGRKPGAKGKPTDE